MKRKLRLLVTDKCDRKCPGCCNKDWDLSALPLATISELKDYDEILLTGGEPFTLLDIIEIARGIKDLSRNKPVFCYTACVKYLFLFRALLKYIDGITLTIHGQEDVFEFLKLQDYLKQVGVVEGKSLRLNVFKGITIPYIEPFWAVKSDMVWIKDCPLPEGEVFKRMY